MEDEILKWDKGKWGSFLLDLKGDFRWCNGGGEMGFLGEIILVS